MTTKTHVRAGGRYLNRNQTLRIPLKIGTGPKAGGTFINRNETLLGCLRLNTRPRVGTSRK